MTPQSNSQHRSTAEALGEARRLLAEKDAKIRELEATIEALEEELEEAYWLGTQ